MSEKKKRQTREEKTIAGFYRSLDNDLARDNLENDWPESDKNDAEGKTHG